MHKAQPRRQEHHLWRAALVGTLLAAVVAVLLPGSAPADPVPSPGQIAKQKQKAAQLARQAGSEAQKLSSLQSELAALADQANEALAQLVLARKRTGAAQAAAVRQERELQAARTDAKAKRGALGSYAASAYRKQGTASGVATIDAVLRANSPAEVSFTQRVLATVGDKRTRMLEAAHQAAAREAVAEQETQRALATAQDAEQQEATAKQKADQLVARQKQLVAEQQKVTSSSQAKAQAAKKVAANMEAARKVYLKRLAEQAKRDAEARARGQVIQGSGTCSLRSASGYPNGMIPPAALCPLWDAPGQLLVWSATNAFNAMSQAYAAYFGRPICVTDSYRSYAMQVDVHNRKPGMTAVPGTSEHGWGKAVDLCDGVNSYNTPTYDWMKANAPRFGWFHPSWAEPGSSRPEPWHWEYSG